MEWYKCKTIGELVSLGNFKEVKKMIECEIGCGIKVKAKGWQQLSDFICSFKATVDKFSLIEHRDDIFTSEAAKYIYILTQLSGKERQEKLGITPIHYKDKDIAEKWMKDIAKVIHPDKCKNILANEAMSKLNLLYKEMVS